jgi:outer membrane protein assembly factor BamA/autotransporter translocation and assembly factor TamB
MGPNARRRLVVLLAGVGVLYALLHLPAVRRQALALALRRVEASSGLRARAEGLDYQLASLDFRVRGLVLESPGREPLVEVKEARARLGVSTLWAHPDLRHVEAAGVRVHLVRDPSGGWNLPPPAAHAAPASPPSIALGSVTVRDAEVLVEDRAAKARVHAPSLALDLAGGGATTRGTVSAGAPVEWSMGGNEGTLELLPAKLAFDGQDLAVESLALKGPEGTLEVTGRLRKVTGAGELDLDVRAATDLGRLPLGGGKAPRGAITIDGRLEGPFAAPVAAASLSGRGVTWGALDDASVDARLRANAEAVDVESATVRVAGGRVDLHGRLALAAAGTTRLQAQWEGLGREVLRVRGLDGTLSGHGAVSGRGSRLADLSVTAEIVTTPTASPAPGSWPLEGRSELTLGGGEWRLTLDHSAGSGLRLAGQAGGRFDEGSPTRSTLAGTVEAHVEDLGRVAPPGAGVSGRAHVAATLGGTLGHPSASGSVEALGVQTRSLAEARADVTARFDADGRQARVTSLEVRSGETSLVADATYGLEDHGLDGRFRFSTPDVAALGVRAPAGIEPAGALQAEGTIGGTRDRPTLKARLSGTGLHAAGQSFDSAAARVQVEGTTFHVESVELVQASGRATLAGDYAPNGSLSLHATARNLAVQPLPGALAGRPDPLPFQGVLTGDITASGRADAPDGKGSVSLEAATWEGREIGPLTADIAIAAGRVTTDLRAPSLGTAVAGRVDVAAPHRFDVEVGLEATDLAALARRLGTTPPAVNGTATGRLRLRGDADTRRIETVEIVRDVVIESGKSHLSVAGGLGGAARAPLVATLEVDLADLTPWLPGPATGALRASLTAKGTPARPVVEGELAVENGTIAFSERRRGTIRGLRATATLRQGTFALENAEATWFGGRFKASGSVTARFVEPWLPTAFRQALGTGPAPWAALQASFDGDAHRWLNMIVVDDTFESRGREASIVMDLAADAPRLDAVRGEVRWTGIDPTLSDVVLTQDGTARLVIEAGKAKLADASWSGPDTWLRVDGTLDYTGDGGLRQARLVGDVAGETDLRVLQFLGRAVETGGFGAFRLHVDGPLGETIPEGEVTFRDGFLRYRPTRVSLDSLQGTLRFSSTGIEAQGVHGSLNGGAITLEGDVKRGRDSGGEVRLRIRGADLEYPQGFRSNLYANLTLAPSGDGYQLSGTTTFGSAVYRTSEYASLQALNAVQHFSSGPPSPMLEKLQLDVHVRTSQDMLIQAVDGRLQVGVDLRATGSASSPVLAGQMTAAPGGQVFMGGRTYDLEYAVVDFSRGNGLEPWVQVRAQTHVSQYTVVAEVTGPATSFQSRFVSDPPLSDRDIVSLLTSGRTISAAAAGAGQTDALSMASGGMLGRTGRMFGFDSVRIERSGERQDLDFDPTAVTSQANPTSRLTFSKRLRNNIQATYSQSLTSAGNNTWFVSWKPWPPFEARVVQRDDRTGALEFRHDVSFGKGPAPPSRTIGTRQRLFARRRTTRSGEKIGSVRVELDGAPAPALQKGLALQPGREFDHEKWLQDRDTLAVAMAKEGHFEARIIARREPPTRQRDQVVPVALEYEIRHGPATTLEFQDFAAPRSLRAAIEKAWYTSEYGRSIEDEAEAQTRALLFDQGYPQPRVRARTRLSPDASVKTVTVIVDPRQKSATHRVVFEGNARVKTERLEALVKGREKQAWMHPEELRKAVAGVYRDEGLLAADVQVGPPRPVESDLELPVAIDEGPEIVVGKVKIEGAAALSPEEVREAAGLYDGQTYKPAEVAAARQRVLEAYHRRGYNNATVRVDGRLDPETFTVSPTFAVVEGERQVIAEVVFEGGPRVRERAERALDLRPGEPVVLSDWAEQRKRLYDSGFFKSVDIEPEKLDAARASTDAAPAGPSVVPVAAPAPPPPGAGHADGDGNGEEEVRAKVVLQQWPALRLRYGLQLVTEGQLASEEGRSKLQLGAIAEVTRRTLWSLPASVGLSVQGRKTYQQARGFFTLPNSFGTPLRTSVFLTGTRQQDIFQDRDLPIEANGRVYEVTLEERLRVGKKVETALSYNTQWGRLDEPQEFEQRTLQNFNLARLIATGLLDGRNDLIDTTRGFFSSVSLEYGDQGLGSDYPIRKLLAQQFVYVPVSRIVLASAARWEKAKGIGTVFFLEDRLLAGGANTVRGYPEDSLGPQQVNLLGGTSSLVVLNQELRFPILGPVRGVLFGDGAILVSRVEDQSRTDSHWSTGLGLRYVTPVGILRLDFGIPLDQGFQPKRGRFYFSLGQIF